jgi:hypothetical protein
VEHSNVGVGEMVEHNHDGGCTETTVHRKLAAIM